MPLPISSRSALLIKAALQPQAVQDDEVVPSTSGYKNPALDSEDSETHVADFDSDDSVLDKNYEPPKPRARSLILVHSSSDSDIIPDSQNVLPMTVPDSSEGSDMEANKKLTKRGTIRKRQTFEASKAERKSFKRRVKVLEQYFVKTGCAVNTCKRKCSAYFTEENRKTINSDFWKKTWKEQKLFFLYNTSQRKPVRPKQKPEEQSVFSKQYDRLRSVSYFLTDEHGTKIQVCKTFFLTTLGYKKTNSKAVRNALDFYNKELKEDGRGHNSCSKKIDDRTVKEHIMSFRPSISHYRREHAPNKKYLPSDLNIRKMYNDFCERYKNLQESQVSYDFYRKVIQKLNISFAKLGQEECELCEKFSIHNPNLEIRHRNCLPCKNYETHHDRYVEARKKYQEDSDKQTHKKNEPNTVYYAVDLEKVIMLPRMEEFKEVIFCPRIIVFNESFVPLGNKQIHDTGRVFAALWHEAISGRKKDDILSCFKAFFLENRDQQHIVLWLDNCASQNKNWTLYSFLVYLVNSAEVSFDTVTFRYLEVGHTFMAADEFHHRVEHSMKTMKRLYDFKDFCNAVSNTGSKVFVKEMNLEDFYEFEDCSSTYKLQHGSSNRPYLSNISEVMVRRGSKSLFYKFSHTSQEYTELDFLRLKNIKNGIPQPRQKCSPRGVTLERKSTILKKLCPLMPQNRRGFWENLYVNDHALDLTTNYED